MRPTSGDQYVIRASGYEAVVASVGASLRRVCHDGRDLILGYGEDELRPAMRGALLAPWPNRTADGTYTFMRAAHRLAINEPELANASHGLVAWLDFALVESSTSRVVLTGTVEPQPGYPWRLRLDVSFHVDERGVTQEVRATNESSEPAPFGVGGHPYLVAGPVARGGIADWDLEVPADELLTVDERRLPTGQMSVRRCEDGRFDFRVSRVIGAAVIDRAYTRLRRTNGVATVRVLAPDKTGVEISWNDRCGWVQVYTSDLDLTGGHRAAVAVEPMTCPPNALNSGNSLVVLEPGQTTTAGWTIRAVTNTKQSSA